MSIENLKRFDPFADADDENGQEEKYIHIRIQQRNGRKTLTTVQGIPPKFDLKKILKEFKKKFACNGTIIDDVKDKDKDKGKDKDKEDGEVPKDPAQKNAAADGAATPTVAVATKEAKEAKEAKDKTAKSTSKPSDKDKRSTGDVIQVQGDQRKNAREFLVVTLGIDTDIVKVHGF